MELCARLRVEIDGCERPIAGRQARLLLAYLVLHRDRPVPRSELIEALWPAQRPADADAALRTLLSRLRAALGVELIAGRQELSLVGGRRMVVDVEAAVAAVARAEVAAAAGDAEGAARAAHAALAVLDRGLLTGLEADWLGEFRRANGDLALRALECLAATGLSGGAGGLANAERAARLLVERAPYRESGHRLLMEALEAGGNRAEALRVYDRLRLLLREELGVPPGPAVQALHRRLLATGLVA